MSTTTTKQKTRIGRVNIMDNNTIKVSYLKDWAPDGACYTQTVKVPAELMGAINTEITEAKDGQTHKTINSNYHHIYLNELARETTNYTTLTTAKLVKSVLEGLGVDVKRFKEDRNTAIIFVGGASNE